MYLFMVGFILYVVLPDNEEVCTIHTYIPRTVCATVIEEVNQDEEIDWMEILVVSRALGSWNS